MLIFLNLPSLFVIMKFFHRNPPLEVERLSQLAFEVIL